MHAACAAVYSGVYVASVVHHQDRVLVADDGRVPMVEVDDAVVVSVASLAADYYWLMKVARLYATATATATRGIVDLFAAVDV